MVDAVLRLLQRRHDVIVVFELVARPEQRAIYFAQAFQDVGEDLIIVGGGVVCPVVCEQDADGGCVVTIDLHDGDLLHACGFGSLDAVVAGDDVARRLLHEDGAVPSVVFDRLADRLYVSFPRVARVKLEFCDLALRVALRQAIHEWPSSGMSGTWYPSCASIPKGQRLAGSAPVSRRGW